MLSDVRYRELRRIIDNDINEFNITKMPREDLWSLINRRINELDLIEQEEILLYKANMLLPNLEQFNAIYEENNMDKRKISDLLNIPKTYIDERLKEVSFYMKRKRDDRFFPFSSNEPVTSDDAIDMETSNMINKIREVFSTMDNVRIEDKHKIQELNKMILESKKKVEELTKQLEEKDKVIELLTKENKGLYRYKEVYKRIDELLTEKAAKVTNNVK